MSKRYWLICGAVLLLALSSVPGAMAQSDATLTAIAEGCSTLPCLYETLTAIAPTATPMPTSTYGAVTLIAPEMPNVAFPLVLSPTPIASATPLVMPTAHLPTGDLINYLATAERNLANAPADISNPGVAVLPNEDGWELWGYAKWLISPATADELFGPFGSMLKVIGAAITLVVVIGLVYFLVFIAVRLLRFVVWIVRTALQFVPFLG